eukprot:6241621-Pyramimonas_sp.AAC.1
MIQCFSRAAALARSPRLDRRAAPQKVAAPKASRSMKTRSARRNLMCIDPWIPRLGSPDCRLPRGGRPP